ncbi:MAG: hypothetical protein ILP19_02770, partial [Oscillospiraceae bacterium]|nr:hypothetical protein [Oscillospiraceae bacterium]
TAHIAQAPEYITASTIEYTNESTVEDSTDEAETLPHTGIFDTLADAETAAGFYFDGRYSEPEGLPCAEYSVTDGNVLKIRYYNTNGDECTVCMSKGAVVSGSSADIASISENIKGCDVAIKGTSCGYYSAEWTKGSSSFSVNSNYAMTLDEMEKTVSDLILG